MEKKNYSKTVNLPKTQFSMKANLSVLEPKILALWNENKVYEKMLKKSANQFILHDGPPYANGVIHIGHALNKILKDIVVKYKSMRGFSTPYVPGWDCHGLPIEHQLFKTLKLDKRQIDKIELRKKAKDFAMKFVDIQRDEFKKLGVFGDWGRPYLTMAPEYESTIIHMFKQLVEKDYIYRAKKPVYWCTHCETALADAEVEYADHISPSIFVKFKVIEYTPALKAKNLPENSSIVIWTTTPWTLPANVALSFAAEENYVFIKTGDEHMVIAEKLLKSVTEKIGLTNYEVTNLVFKGKDFEYIKCKNPLIDSTSTGILADFVSLEDGSGIVHNAPGHGQEDYVVGLKYNLPILSPVDDKGAFTSEVPEFCGHRVFAANPMITKRLKEIGALLNETEITHSYPHCWRCKHAVIFRATYQWFMNVDLQGLRKKLLNSVKDVKWIPEYGIKRITGMLENRPDWCLSRQRYWGLPIPAIKCEKCEDVSLNPTVIEKFEKYTKTESSDCWFSRPIEDFLPSGYKCKCGNDKFKKESDIFDVWFESGGSHEVVLSDKSNWPADMYLEGRDQHRGWFQLSLIPSVALHGKAPFKEVLTHGFVVDAEGKKMSKSQGNVIAPQEIMKSFGAEILRLWVSSSDYSEDIRISKEIIERLVETYRKIRNTVRFIIGNLCDYDANSNKIKYEDLLELDKYMLLRLQQLNKDVTKAYDSYEFHSVVSLVNNFCVLDLSGFYLDILKDRLYTYPADSKERRSAQTVLQEILITMLKLISPILSFTAEEAWQTLRQESKNISEASASIYMETIPEPKTELMNETIEKNWKKIMEVRDKANMELESARKSALIGGSLEAKLVIETDNELLELLKKYQKDLPAILIVSQLELKPISEGLKITVSHAEGKKCPRCWNWSTETAAEDLCPRCKDTIAKLI
ncbi:MAG: isoleucine--tRNA ligase [Elusimicrobiota bacterium]